MDLMRSIEMLLLSALVVLVTCPCLTSAVESSLTVAWETYKASHGKHYDTPDKESLRQAIWERNNQMIKTHNEKATEGRRSYKLGINRFADTSMNELGPSMVIRDKDSRLPCPIFKHNAEVQDLPDSVDWRELGAVTPPKDQDICGSCWAFAAAGAIEAVYYQSSGELIELSPQHLIDCARDGELLGCYGGWSSSAFIHVIDNGGIATEQSYPYEAKNGKCHMDETEVVATVNMCYDIRNGSEIDLQAAVALHGPVTVCIDTGAEDFHLYKEGIYEAPECSKADLVHCMLVVGYGTENDKDYWLVKNSFGESWGEDGYIRLPRNAGNHCGIATMASFPVFL